MKKYCFILFLIYSTILISQNSKIDSLKELLNTNNNQFKTRLINLELARAYEYIDLNESKKYTHKALILSNNDSLNTEANIQLGRIHFFSSHLDSATFYFEKAKKYFDLKKQLKRVAQINISIGAIKLRQGNYGQTIKIFTECAKYFESQNDSLNTAKCFSNISTALAELEKYDESIDYSYKALAIFSKLKMTQFELITLPNLAAQHLKNGDTLRAIFYNEEAEKIALKSNNKRSLSIIYNNLGSIYLDKNNQKSKEYLENSLNLKRSLKLESGVEIIEANLAYLNLKKGNYNQAISYYHNVEKKVEGKRLIHIYKQLSFCYKQNKDFKNALLYAEKYSKLSDSILKLENLKSFNEIQTKYETEKKEKEIINLKAENLEINIQKNKNKYILVAVIGALLFILFSGFFSYKNIKKKKLITLQKHKIKTQEFEKKIQKLELKGIEDIITIQESERTRIANDLHDNLGSKIATLKLLIEQLKNTHISKNDFDKVLALADDTYNEVRKIAHNKKFGTLINEGLIEATKKLADNLSIIENLNIEIIDINTSKSINNSIEIQLFRIIQELLANIVKHAKASEAIITFSQSDNVITILIEDNGIGFKPSINKNGFGLNSVQKRVDSLQGTFNIDSNTESGTTIIITIPI